MIKEDAVKAVAWREPKSEKGYVYRLQINGLSTRTEKKILRVCTILILCKAFQTEEEWISWAKEFPYPLREQNNKGEFKSIKLGTDSKNVRRGRPRKEKKSA